MQIRDYDPSQGDFAQGDVDLFLLPSGVKLSPQAVEIAPKDDRLIIQEGETTGHHHAIARPRAKHFRTSGKVDPVLDVTDTRLRKAFGGGAAKEAIATARLYRDPAAIATLVQCGELTRADLAIGILVVEGAPVLLAHEEHDSIRIPPGRYYVGRQIESSGAEERAVRD